MMTSSNGNIFHVIASLCGEFTGDRWIPHTKASDAVLWWFFHLRLNKRLNKQSWGWWFETPSYTLWRHCNEHRTIFTLTALFIRHSNLWRLSVWHRSVSSFMINEQTWHILYFITVLESKRHYSEVTWPSWRFKPPAIPLFPSGDVTMIGKYNAHSHFSTNTQNRNHIAYMWCVKIWTAIYHFHCWPACNRSAVFVSTVAWLTEKFNPSLTKPPLKFKGGLAKHGSLCSKIGDRSAKDIAMMESYQSVFVLLNIVVS